MSITLSNPYAVILSSIWGIIMKITQVAANNLGISLVSSEHPRDITYEYNTDNGAATPLEPLHPEHKRDSGMKGYLALKLPGDIFKGMDDTPIASAYFEHVLGLEFWIFATYAHIAALSSYYQRPVFWTELVKGELIDLELAEKSTREIETLLAYGLIEEVCSE